MKRILLVLSAIVIVTGLSFSQSEYNIIDYDMVIQTLPEYTIGKEKLEQRKKELNDSMEIMSIKYNKLVLKLSNIGDVYIISNKKQKEQYDEIEMLKDSIQKMQEDAMNFQQYSDKEIVKFELEINNELRKRLISILELFCKQNNISSMLEKKYVLFCSNCKNYTKEIIEYIRKSE